MIAVIVATGCATRFKYDLLKLSTVGVGPSADTAGHDPDIVIHYGEEEPNLYQEPAAPKDFTPIQQKDYLTGYRTGWVDAIDDVPVITVPGDDQLYFMLCPGSVIFNKENDAIRRGVKDGTARARVDFNVFCIQLEKKLWGASGFVGGFFIEREAG
jgi:hypothetical protein